MVHLVCMHALRYLRSFRVALVGLLLTTRPGTGKSVLLREIIKTLRKKYVKSADAVAVTASTG